MQWMEIKAAQHGKTYLLSCAPNEDSNQPAYPPVWSVFVVRIKKRCILGYSKCAQWRFWSDCANAQADLNLRWAHMSEGTFSDIRLISNFHGRLGSAHWCGFRGDELWQKYWHTICWICIPYLPYIFDRHAWANSIDTNQTVTGFTARGGSSLISEVFDLIK